MTSLHVRDCEVEVIGLGSRRASVFPKALLRASRIRHTGVLRADRTGVRIAMHNSTPFRRLVGAMNRQSTMIKTLCTIDEIDSFGLVDGSQQKREGLWKLVATVNGKQETFDFKSASVFDAVGWLQALRILRGEKEIPVVAVLGETGVGKSLLASRLAGLPPDNTVFQVGADVESVTERTDMFLSNWMGDPEQGEVIVIDTPGLSDSQGRDASNVAEMMTKLAQLGGVHCFLVIFSAENPRLSGSLRAMLDIFETSFGPKFWGHAMLVFSRWRTNKSSEKERGKKGVTMESTKEKWNEALVKAFPSIGRMARRDTALHCFFVDSDPDADEPAECARADAQLHKLSVLARQNRLFDVTDELPDAGVDFQGGKVPEEMSALAALLRQLRLTSKLKRLQEEGITEVEALTKLRGAQLRSMLGWTEEEVARLRGMSTPIDTDAPNYAVVQDFQQLGLPTTELERLGLGAGELMRLSDREVRGRLGLNVSQMSAYEQWRNTVLRHTPVLDENLWVGAIVTRRDSAWPYDEEGVVTQDLRGPGIVLNFVPRLGDQQPVGELSPPPRWTGHPRAYEPPTQPGWARVYWFTTGYSNCYRVGAGDRSDLKYDVAAEHGIESADPASVDRAVFAEKEFDRVPAASDLRCTFGFSKGMKYAHWVKFDARPSVCKALGGVVPGDVVQMSTNQQVNFACIGAIADAAGGAVLFFKVLVPNAESTSTFEPGTMLRRVGTLRLTEIPHAGMQCHADDGIDNDALDVVDKMLDESFQYAVGNNFPIPATFDIRDEVLSKFGYNLRHGQELMLKEPRVMFVVIGVSKHKSDVPRFWLHQQGHAGATIWPGMWEDLATRFERTGRTVALQARVPNVGSGFNRPTEAQLRALTLTPNLDFPRGVGQSVMGRFDASPRTCVLLCGHVSGTVLSVGGSDMELTVIGAAKDDATGLPEIWFHATGTAGAGTLDQFYDMMDAGAFTASAAPRDLAQLRDELVATQRQMGGMMELLRRLAEATGEVAEQPAAGPTPGSSRNLPATDGDDDEGGSADDAFYRWLARETGNRD